ncbi:hypothetical protein RS130_01230 [Paraglaciecola aquimarina]|uniref:GH16 domain-containing protein n=1 Tax=Paraglaciecola aquimarina TaxID=1235557 RepID=A0ABU3SRU5_9ALTE|nr:hypothetical protein [Paraglaciecola aquimarina]MDU0352720.1 hypothetical protein [Paraglaciecola aquimarina]
MKLIKLALTSSLLTTSLAYAKPPEPELGKRWVINNAYSDEFNGNSLDKRKWLDHHRTWKGRPPAMFDPSTVSVQNGNMQITNKMLEKPNKKFTISGGAVQSIGQTAYHGFYESRFKASRINMSTTFWLSNRNVPFEGKNHLGQDCERDGWSMELDIVEAVGGVIDKAFGANFRQGMQYNTHVWYSGCEKGSRSRFSKGANVAEGDGTQAFNNKLPKGEEVWQNFNTYAAWWKDENEVDFYLNDGFAGRIQVDTSLLEKPYSRPMSMQLLTETYDWGRPLPTPEQLADNSINTSYYDWVRSYYYVDVDKDAVQQLERVGKADDIFVESATVKTTKLVRDTLQFTYLYETDEDVTALIELTKDSQSIYSQTVKLKAGYGHLADQIKLTKAMDFDNSQLTIHLLSNSQQKIASSKPVKVSVNVK